MTSGSKYEYFRMLKSIEKTHRYESTSNRRCRIYRESFVRPIDRENFEVTVVDNLSTGRIENIEHLDKKIKFIKLI